MDLEKFETLVNERDIENLEMLKETIGLSGVYFDQLIFTQAVPLKWTQILLDDLEAYLDGKRISQIYINYFYSKEEGYYFVDDDCIYVSVLEER